MMNLEFFACFKTKGFSPSTERGDTEATAKTSFNLWWLSLTPPHSKIKNTVTNFGVDFAKPLTNCEGKIIYFL